jgi:hypothetical protein
MTNPFGKPADNEEDFDFDAHLEGGGEEDSKYLIPDGTYTVRVIDLEKTVSSNGNPMYVWTFAVEDSPSPDLELKMWSVLTPQAKFRLNNTLAALGITGKGKAAAINKRAKAVVKASEYTKDGETKKSSKIEKLLPL